MAAAGVTVSLAGTFDFHGVEFEFPSSSGSGSRSSGGRRGYVVECDGDVIEEHFPGLRLLRFQSPLVISRASAVGALLTQQSLVGGAVPLVVLDRLCGEALTDASLHTFFAVCACVLPGVRCRPLDPTTASSYTVQQSAVQTSAAQVWSLLVLAELWQSPRLVDALATQLHNWLCPGLPCTRGGLRGSSGGCSCKGGGGAVCKCLPDPAARAIPAPLRGQVRPYLSPYLSPYPSPYLSPYNGALRARYAARYVQLGHPIRPAHSILCVQF